MKDTLSKLRTKAVIGFVGGSDLSKQYEQLGSTSKLDNTNQEVFYVFIYDNSFGRFRLLFC